MAGSTPSISDRRGRSETFETSADRSQYQMPSSPVKLETNTSPARSLSGSRRTSRESAVTASVAADVTEDTIEIESVALDPVSVLRMRRSPGCVFGSTAGPWKMVGTSCSSQASTASSTVGTASKSLISSARDALVRTRRRCGMISALSLP